MSEEQNQPPEFHAVVLNNDGEMLRESFHTSAALADRLKKLINADVSVACFRGTFLPISKPPLRYLMTAEENIPLWDAPTEVEADGDGVQYLGVDPVILAGPSQVNTPPVQQEDEFFTDDSDDIGSIFDDPLPNPDN